jgi:hypothetical protein
MEHEIKYDEQNEVAILSSNADLKFIDIEPLSDRLKMVLEGKKHRQLISIISDVYVVENRETREALAEALSKLNLSEVAFVGGSAYNRIMAKILIKTGIVRLNGDFFKDIEEAMEWLKSKRK